MIHPSTLWLKVLLREARLPGWWHSFRDYAREIFRNRPTWISLESSLLSDEVYAALG